MNALVTRRSLASVMFRSVGSGIGSFARMFMRTSDIGVCKTFLEEAQLTAKQFRREVVTNDGLTVVAGPFFICTRCRSGRSREVECVQPVLERSVFGRRVGAMYWSVPVCSSCDGDPPLDLTNPILVRCGKRLDGYGDIPASVRMFFKIRFKSDPQ